MEHKRPHNQELQEFAAEWDLRYEEAKEKAGLDINNVAKSYLWMKQSGLPQRHLDDLRLQLHGDMNRFHDLRGLAVRLSHRVDKAGNTGDVFYEDEKTSTVASDQWDAEDHSYWAEPGWYEEDWIYHTDEHFGEETWYEDEEEIFDPYEYEAWQGEPAMEPGYQGRRSIRRK